MNTPVDERPIEPTASPTRVPIRKRFWFRLLRALALFYVAWCATLYFYQDRMLFPADAAGPPSPLMFSWDTVQLERPVEGVGKVAAWFVPAFGATAQKPAPLVVYFHGNAELIDHQSNTVTFYRRLGCNVLLPEYRGYGRSAGKPGEAAIVDDAAYFLGEALARPGVDAGRLVFHGRSLGGGPAARLADRHTPQVMILESTFTSAAAMAHAYAAPAFLSRNPFHVDDVVARLDIPILLFHGTTDDIIPVRHGRTLRDLARHGTYVEYDCHHNDFPGPDEEDYWRRIETFLTESGILTPTSQPASGR